MSASSNSGSSIKRFFIYHCEKLILALSIILLGLFFWFGYSTPTYENSTPSKLVDQAERVGRQMNDPEAWSKIRSAREGDSEVFNRIVNSPELNAADYAISPASFPVKRSTKRTDANILAPESLVAKPFFTPILIQPKARLDADDDPLPMEMYQPVKAGAAGMMAQSQMDYDMDEEEMMDMEEDFGNSRPSKRTKREPKEEPVNMGTFVSTASRLRTPGVTGTFQPNQVKSYNMPGIAVTALVKHEAMWLDFQNRYQSSLGYHPDRDTPRYDYLQVRRREVRPDGSLSEWTDLSKRLADQRDYFPTQLETAPEVVGADEYDGVICTPIPPFLEFDYKELAVHPDVPMREFYVPEPLDEGDADNPMADTEDEDDFLRKDRRPSRPSSAIGGGRGGRGGMDDGYGDERRSRRRMRGGRMMQAGDVARSADDVTDYLEISVRDQPSSPFKVVRFFDIYGVAPGKTYEYQTRVWLRDPNNEDPELFNDVGVNPDLMDDGMMESPQGMEEAQRFAKKTVIGSSMIDPQARRRLRKAREEKSNRGSTYYVSEPYGENGELVEIQVPAGQDYLRYARPTRWSDPVKVTFDASPTFVYAGPPVESRRIEIGRGSVPGDEPAIQVAAGKVMTKNEDLAGVKVPFRALVRAGDLLDFNKPTHARHPVTRVLQRVDGVEVATGHVVLDISESEQLEEFSKRTPVPYFYPGEVLVLDAAGNVDLRNDIEDRIDYSITTFDPDEDVTFGTIRRPRKKKTNELDDDYDG